MNSEKVVSRIAQRASLAAFFALAGCGASDTSPSSDDESRYTVQYDEKGSILVEGSDPDEIIVGSRADVIYGSAWSLDDAGAKEAKDASAPAATPPPPPPAPSASKCNPNDLVLVQYCDVPSSSVATKCQSKDGCDLRKYGSAPLEECKRDANRICGKWRAPMVVENR